MIKILDTYRRKLLQKKAAKIHRNIRLIQMSDVMKMGILWDEYDEKAYKFLYDHFKSPKVIIRFLCYTKNKTLKDSNLITPKDITWLGFPRSGAIEKFMLTEFDLLLNISATPNFTLDAISALSAATLKIGWDQGQEGLFDISIDVSKQPDAMYLAEQQLFYLKQLNKRIDL